MAPILRVKAEWTGFTGAPGYSVFHFRDFGTGEGGTPTDEEAQSAATRTQAFFQSCVNYIPGPVRIGIASDCELLEETTGELIDVVPITPPTQTAGSAASAQTYSGPVGAVINWRTSVVHRGRRIRGRTFLVPLLSLAFESNGTLGATARQTILDAANTLAGTGNSPDLGVWSRPSAPGMADGNWGVVSGVTVPDMGAVLRSRRD